MKDEEALLNFSWHLFARDKGQAASQKSCCSCLLERNSHIDRHAHAHTAAHTNTRTLSHIGREAPAGAHFNLIPSFIPASPARLTQTKDTETQPERVVRCATATASAFATTKAWKGEGGRASSSAGYSCSSSQCRPSC